MATLDPTPGPAALPRPEHLPDDPATLKRLVLELLATLHQERHDKEALRQRLDLLLRRLYGPKGERFDPSQPLLFDPGDETPASDTPVSADEATAARPSRRHTPHGRRPLPEDLPRRVVEHQLTEAQRVCSCGQVRRDIGVEQTEQLDYQPAALFVWQHRIHKYACPACAARLLQAPAAAAQATSTTEEVADAERGPVVISAPRPPRPIARGLPGPGLLAFLITSKFADHLPLYRLERILQRQGFEVPRSTTGDWLAACAQVLQPLYQRMVTLVLQSRWLHTDDTPVKNQQPAPGSPETARLWAYLGDESHPFNVFDFTASRKRDGPQSFLADFKGYLHADAFSGYDALYLPRPQGDAAPIVEVACNAHARRKFYQARTSDAARSHLALAYYGQLYEIERRARELELEDERRRQMRQELAVPILEQLRAWLEAERAAVLPKSPMGEAIGYALNNWSALIRYTEAGFLSIDNNVAEREMKRIAIGRKNWLFVGSETGGQTAAVLLSFTSTCQRLQIEPWAYLQDVLSRLPTMAAEQLDELLPDRWQAEREAPGQGRRRR